MRRAFLAMAAFLVIASSSAQAALLRLDGISTAGQTLSVGFSIDNDEFIRPIVGNGTSNAWSGVVRGGFIQHGSLLDTFSFSGITSNVSSLIEPFNGGFEDNFSITVRDQNAGRQRVISLLFGIGRFGATHAFNPGETIVDLGFVLPAFVDAVNDPTSALRTPIPSLNFVDPFGGPSTSFASFTGASFELFDVPAPATAGMMALAFLGLGVARRRRPQSGI